MKAFEIFKAKLGMDIVSPETALPDGAVRDLVNFDVSNAGKLSARGGARRLSTTAGAHSLWSPRSRAFGLYVQGDALRQLVPEGPSLRAVTLLQGLQLRSRMRYTEFDGTVFCTNGLDLLIVGSDGAVGSPGTELEFAL